jgi:hypothetical protein
MRISGPSHLLLAVAAAVLVTACSGTGDGGTGDPPSEPDADAYGDGRRVQDLVGEADWYDEGNPDSVGCDVPGRRRTRVTGLTIVAVDEFDEANEGRSGNVYAVQTPEKGGLEPYSGISLRTPGRSPPDLRLFQNQVIDVSGDFLEFLGPPSSNPFGSCKTLPQIEGTVTYRFDGNPVDPYLLVPAQAASPDQDRWAPLKTYEAARPYIGMLVRIEDVTLSEVDIDAKGALFATIDVGGGIDATDTVEVSNELYDIEGTSPALAAGSTFASITGVVTYFYGFKIAPRSSADFVRANTGG